jgi:hypothetical protein
VDVAKIVRDAAASLEQTRKAIRAGLDEIDAPGLEEPDDATFMAWVQTMAGAGDPAVGLEPGQYPPIPLVSEDGREYVASPWLEALQFVDGGDDILNRIARIQRKIESEVA